MKGTNVLHVIIIAIALRFVEKKIWRFIENNVWYPNELPQQLQVNKKLCGSGWQEHYKKLNQDILERKREEKYVINVAIEAGISDRITGAVTMFYFALFSGRAYQFHTYPHLRKLEVVFDYASFNWSLSEDHPLPAYNHLGHTRTNPGFHKPDPSFKNPQYASIDHANSDISPFYVFSDLSNIKKVNSTKYIFMASNRGMSYHVFDNPHHWKQLRDWGLRPEHGFYCGFHYLFKPNQKVNKLIQRNLKPFEEKKPYLKIGIQIRTGDLVFKNNKKDDLKDYMAFFECAEEIERSRSLGKKTLWYLISDSLHLKQQAKRKFGDKLITNTEDKIYHTDCEGYHPDKCNPAVMDRNMQNVMAEILTLSTMDFHIITWTSGLGNIASWLSPNWHHTYRILFGRRRKCGILDYDINEELVATSAGI